jgi:hAT family C-terminal dimerisation region
MIPMLARLAREIFAIPAMSAPSERIFSSTGLIIMESRLLLNTDRAEELIFCQQNYRRVASLKLKLDKTAYQWLICLNKSFYRSCVSSVLFAKELRFYIMLTFHFSLLLARQEKYASRFL